MKTEDKKLSHYNYVESGKADIAYMQNSPHVLFRQITEEKRRGKELRVVKQYWVVYYESMKRKLIVKHV